MSKKISILIPTLPTRIGKLKNLIDSLNKQVNENNYQDVVQILIDGDTKEITIGAKRNRMINNAIGDYIVFIDDDDNISTDYVSLILSAIMKKPDCVTFKGEYFLNGHKTKNIVFSLQFNKNWENVDSYYRLPNHLCCIKRVIALKCPFPNLQYGEDEQYAIRLKKILKSECHINSKLYFYLYNEKESQTHPNGINSAY